ncbi:Neuronal acetylcholine receptor subunit alpha-6 [Stylophora pistillata]|uniref:Neuronal acetylcholine receptor subunit alpha-6 n=3 Tax=Stylophora pistillata TaxID=50429 RepID=A0A2B4SND8_STYPI|nr:Neuronal acetylcholine receptor subunit alpha-6 [Stylophora pistillata]
MSPHDVWVPDTVLYNNADEDATLSGFKEKFKTYVMVYSDGTNKWMSPATFKSSCDMRVTFYPFDTQECKMTFGSWTFDSRLLRMITPAGKYSHSEKFIESGDWTLEDVTIESANEDFNCCDHPFSNIIYSFHFQRKTLYHVLYQILPCVVIILLVILNFIIPPDSGERISFCITILLSMSVYLLILADSLPETSDDVAILGLYYMATIFLIGFSLVGTVVVLRCHFAERKPSASLVKFAKFVLRRNERKKTNNTVFARSKSPTDPQETVENEVKKAVNTPGDNDPAFHTMKEKREQCEWKDSWREIGEAIDRLLLVIFLTLGFAATCAIWIQKP